jgi:hypothetical protein
LLAQRLIQRVAVIRAIADQVLGLRLDHVEVEPVRKSAATSALWNNVSRPLVTGAVNA